MSAVVLVMELKCSLPGKATGPKPAAKQVGWDVDAVIWSWDEHENSVYSAGVC